MDWKEKTSDVIPSNSTTRVRVISLDLSVAPYREMQDWIMLKANSRESRTVCCANVHMVVEAKRDSRIAEAVNYADRVTPDGVPLLWAMRGLHAIEQERIAGMDLMISLLQQAAAEGVSVFFYGSTLQVLDKIRVVCSERFPNLRIAGMVSPPFRETKPEEDDAIVKQIASSQAGLVFVALGCPKQELWMAKMRGRIPAVMIGLGGALPLLAGYQNRAPYWIRQCGLEWIFRLVQEPRRLFKRYTVTNSLYIWYFGQQWIAKFWQCDSETVSM